MFRCGNCGSGYSARAATWESCPRCYAKEGTEMPLALEFGWHSSRPEREDAEPGGPAPEARVEEAARPAATA